jgi:general stress protein 26
MEKSRHLWTLIKDIRFAMFTGRASDGTMRSRPLTTQNRDYDEAEPTLWFFVQRDSEVARNVAADGNVNLAYADPDDDCYLSIAGRARCVDDPERARALWSMPAKAWFPGGPDDPTLQLLRVDVVHAEYWDVDDSKMVQFAKMAKAAVSGRPPRDMGEHRRVR